MTTPATTDPDAVQVRAAAASLFAAAAADEGAGHGTQLRCIAAQLALQAPHPLLRESHQPADAAIDTALSLLGALSVDQFADPRIREACRHGRAALRGGA